MTAKNDVTGDLIKTKTSNKLYEEGWERVFGKKEPKTDDKWDSNTEEDQKEKEPG